jgi:hypothetical protein
MLIPWKANSQIGLLSFQTAEGAAKACAMLSQNHIYATLQILYL